MRPQAEHRRLPEPLGEGRGHRAAMAGTPGRAAPPSRTFPRPNPSEAVPLPKPHTSEAVRFAYRTGVTPPGSQSAFPARPFNGKAFERSSGMNRLPKIEHQPVRPREDRDGVHQVQHLQCR